MSGDARLLFGKTAEALAATHLRKLGYHIEASNFRCRLGEIDLVASKDKQLLFVEVRARRSHDFMHPLESLDRKKLSRLRRTAQFYLMRHPHPGTAMRFDVISIEAPAGGGDANLEHITDAFGW